MRKDVARLDYVWLITIIYINLNITHWFPQGYFKNLTYKRIFCIWDINNKVKNATQVGMDFKLIKGFFYYITN